MDDMDDMDGKMVKDHANGETPLYCLGFAWVYHRKTSQNH